MTGCVMRDGCFNQIVCTCGAVVMEVDAATSYYNLSTQQLLLPTVDIATSSRRSADAAIVTSTFCTVNDDCQRLTAPTQRRLHSGAVR